MSLAQDIVLLCHPIVRDARSTATVLTTWIPMNGAGRMEEAREALSAAAASAGPLLEGPGSAVAAYVEAHAFLSALKAAGEEARSRAAEGQVGLECVQVTSAELSLNSPWSPPKPSRTLMYRLHVLPEGQVGVSCISRSLAEPTMEPAIVM